MGPCGVVKTVQVWNVDLSYSTRGGIPLLCVCVSCSVFSPFCVWCFPVNLHFSLRLCSISPARKPVTATSDVQLSAMRSRIAELKAQLKGGGDRDSTAMGSLGVSYEEEGIGNGFD